MAPTPFDPASIQSFLGMLLGRDVTVSKGGHLLTGTRDPFVFATYHDHGDQLIGICACEIALAADLAGALSMFPAAVVKKTRTSGVFEVGLWENLEEVFNIASSIFSDHAVGQVHLHEVLKNSPDVPKEMRRTIRKAPRDEFRVNIAGYGGGGMALIRPTTP